MYYTYITLAGENKVSLYEMNSDTGELSFREDVGLSGGPGPIAVDPKQQFMHIGIRSTPEIASFRIDPDTGGLSPLGTLALDTDPCHMSMDHTGKFLFSAYYFAGKVTVHSIGGNGAAADKVTEVATAEHAHCVQIDRSNRYLFVPHTVPPNAIYQFLFDQKTGALTPNAVPKVTRPEGEGPRHYVYHPTEDFVYVSNEDSSTVTAYRFDPEIGTLSGFQTLSTLPDNFTGENTCAQIHMTPCGRLLFVSNRGHDSIACYGIDQETGTMTPLGQQETEREPRVFNVDPKGEFLLAAGRLSGKLEVFKIDVDGGSLTSLSVYDVGDQPLWVSVLQFDK